MEKHWFLTYWITLLICSRFPVESILWDVHPREINKPTNIQLKSLLNTPRNHLLALPRSVGLQSGEMDNPNKIQKLMAQEFIRSVSNLFSAYEENSVDNKFLPDSYVKPMHDIKARMKQLEAIGLIPRSYIASEGDVFDECRRKRSCSISNNSDSFYKIYKCCRVGPNELECSKVLGMLVPNRKSHKRSKEFKIRDLYHELHKRQCLMKNDVSTYNNPYNGDTVPQCFRKNWEVLNKKIKSNNSHEIGSESLRSLSHFTAEKNHEPPVELTMSQDESSRHSSKWLKRQAPSGLLEPRMGRYDILTPDRDVRAEELSCRRCTPSSKPTPTRLSANFGKTAKIRFPASHRCIRNTCPCRVTKMAVPQRTTCPPEPLFTEESRTGRCDGLDNVKGALTSSSSGITGTLRYNNTEDDEIDSSDAQQKAKRSFFYRGRKHRRSHSQDHSGIHLLESRSCDCRCGCSCRKGGLHPEHHVAVGRTACGCSCGCGCVHLPGSPDSAPHQLRSKERFPVS